MSTQAESATERAEARQSAAERESRRRFILALVAILAVTIVALVFTAGVITQHVRYMDQFTRRQASCVSGGGTWSQNVGGDWECRH